MERRGRGGLREGEIGGRRREERNQRGEAERGRVREVKERKESKKGRGREGDNVKRGLLRILSWASTVPATSMILILIDVIWDILVCNKLSYSSCCANWRQEDPFKDPHEDLKGSLKIFEKFSPGTGARKQHDTTCRSPWDYATLMSPLAYRSKGTLKITVYFQTFFLLLLPHADMQGIPYT